MHIFPVRTQWCACTEKTVSISFHIEWDMIVGTVFLSIFWTKWTPFGSKSKGKLSPRLYPIQFERNGKHVFSVYKAISAPWQRTRNTTQQTNGKLLKRHIQCNGTRDENRFCVSSNKHFHTLVYTGCSISRGNKFDSHFLAIKRCIYLLFQMYTCWVIDEYASIRTYGTPGITDTKPRSYSTTGSVFLKSTISKLLLAETILHW